MSRLLTLIAVCTVPLAGCSDRSSESADQDTAGPASPAASTGAATSIASTSPSPGPTGSSGQDIPIAMRGRFGLVPADCTSPRGDAKGLVTISSSGMRFYESVATLKEVKPTPPTQLRGWFAYSGEGMEWAREVSLQSGDGGRTLIMEEFGEDAPPGPRTYTRCD